MRKGALSLKTAEELTTMHYLWLALQRTALRLRTNPPAQDENFSKLKSDWRKPARARRLPRSTARQLSDIASHRFHPSSCAFGACDAGLRATAGQNVYNSVPGSTHGGFIGESTPSQGGRREFEYQLMFSMLQIIGTFTVSETVSKSCLGIRRSRAGVIVSSG